MSSRDDEAMNESVKKIIMWDHSRETSVYVVFCLLIVAFIFLTPKSWFNKEERFATNSSRIIVQSKYFSPDHGLMKARIREISGIPDAEILNTRERTDARGEKFYEIEFR